jgi:hypothetical protein
MKECDPQSQYSAEETKENHKIISKYYAVTKPRFDPRTSKLRSENC